MKIFALLKITSRLGNFIDSVINEKYETRDF